MLRALPYPEPMELVAFGGRGNRPIVYRRWQDGLESFEAIGASWNVSLNLTGEGPPQRLRASRVSPDLLSILGARPHLGRLLLPEDYEESRSVVVLGFGLRGKGDCSCHTSCCQQAHNNLRDYPPVPGHDL